MYVTNVMRGGFPTIWQMHIEHLDIKIRARKENWLRCGSFKLYHLNQEPESRRWPPSVSRDDGCTRLSRRRPVRVVWESWSAQSPGPLSQRCWQGPTERQANTVGASPAAGVAGRCCNAWLSVFGASLTTGCSFKSCPEQNQEMGTT